jgi:hypothetical protein
MYGTMQIEHSYLLFEEFSVLPIIMWYRKHLFSVFIVRKSDANFNGVVSLSLVTSETVLHGATQRASLSYLP